MLLADGCVLPGAAMASPRKGKLSAQLTDEVPERSEIFRKWRKTSVERQTVFAIEPMLY